MAPVAPPSKLSSGTDTPADHLWKFQLRKENAVLRELLEESKRQQQAADAENKRKIKEGEERLAALEAREAEYELQKQRELQALNKDREEVTSMKAQMESFLRQQRVSDEELQRLIMKQCSANSLPSAPHVPGSSVEHREEPVEGRPLASNAFTNAAPSATRSRAKDQQQANLPEQAPKPTKSSTTRRPKARDNTQRPAPAAREPAAQSTSTSRRPQTRSSTSKFFDTPSEPTFSPVASEPERGRLPKLTQGTSHIKTYYATACATFEGVDITGVQTEIDYISAFIKGLREDKHQSKLTEALQQFHPSRVRDGRIEILCEWEDMREGLIKAGLLGSKEKDKSVAGKKKGRLLSSENLSDYRY